MGKYNKFFANGLNFYMLTAADSDDVKIELDKTLFMFDRHTKKKHIDNSWYFCLRRAIERTEEQKKIICVNEIHLFEWENCKLLISRAILVDELYRYAILETLPI